MVQCLWTGSKVGKSCGDVQHGSHIGFAFGWKNIHEFDWLLWEGRYWSILLKLRLDFDNHSFNIVMEVPMPLCYVHNLSSFIFNMIYIGCSRSKNEIFFIQFDRMEYVWYLLISWLTVVPLVLAICWVKSLLMYCIFKVKWKDRRDVKRNKGDSVMIISQQTHTFIRKVSSDEICACIFYYL